MIVSFCTSCKKDTIILPTPEPEPVISTEYKVTFVFVNRFGFRNDSTQHGIIDTMFQGPCLDSKYYDKAENVTHLAGTCYNRNFPANNFPLTDSIIFKQYKSSVGSKFAYQIELGWKNTNFATTKILKYTSLGWPNGDTIKIAKDTLIKFIWPNDTNSGRFVRTYQWP